MKKVRGLLLLTLSLGSIAAQANPVGVQTAQQVARNFMTGMGVSSQATFDLTRTYTSTAASGAASFYIFGIDNGKGFVIISADDAVRPILGYSAENTFPAQVTNKEVAYWMDGYNEQISYVIEHNVPATAAITAQWTKLINNTQSNTGAKPTDVAPLLTTTWDQEGPGNTYNNMCPTGTPTGCVATAMAQIMKYWNAPTTGTGTHTYTYSNANVNGTLTANFGTTTYDWNNMPNALTASSSSVQKNAVGLLMSHCGISVDMDYNYGSAGGSGAFVIISQSPVTNCAEYAFKTYFGYSSDIVGESRPGPASDAIWISKLKTELDAHRPILYTGFGSVGGHAFVFDGYNDANTTFHINWGWGGMSNGYFTIDNLAPSALGVGAGSGNFNSGQQALMKIYPTNEVPALQINSALTASATTIDPGGSFSVSTNIKNAGQGDFLNGYFIAGVYNSSNTLVSYFNSQSGQNLTAGNDVAVTFTTTGIAAMTPGDYTVKILYKASANATWTVIDNGAATNSVTVHVGGTGISNIPGAELVKVYPVPAKSALNIDFGQFNGKVTDVRLTNVQGRTIYNQEIKNGTTARIDVNGFADGIYFLHIQTEKGTIAKKITVQK